MQTALKQLNALTADYGKSHAASYHLLSLIYIELDMLAEALKACNKFIYLQPDSANAYVIKGSILSKGNRFIDAVVCYQSAQARGYDKKKIEDKILALDPESSTKKLNKLGKLQKTDYSNLYILKGDICKDRAELHQALYFYIKAKSVNPFTILKQLDQKIISLDVSSYYELSKLQLLITPDKATSTQILKVETCLEYQQALKLTHGNEGSIKEGILKLDSLRNNCDFILSKEMASENDTKYYNTLSDQAVYDIQNNFSLW